MSTHLQIINLAKRYGRTAALEDISLSVERGSVVAVLGPNGAGKSTLFACLLGLAGSARGQILWRHDSGTGRVRFGYVAERVALYPHRTVTENIDYFANLRGLPADHAARQLARAGLDPVRDRKVLHLSKGMLQRLGLAIALCGQPEMLVLDEPFNGLDPAVLDSLQAILREENERGATLLISTHTMSAVEPLATHVAILLAGRLATYCAVDVLRAQYADSSLESIYHQIARREGQEVFA